MLDKIEVWSSSRLGTLSLIRTVANILGLIAATISGYYLLGGL